MPRSGHGGPGADGSALLVLVSGYNTGFSYPDGKPIVHVVPDPLTGRPSSVTTSNAQWVFVYDVTGAQPLGLNDANAVPMDAVFNATPSLAPFDAVIPGNLCRPAVHPHLVPECHNPGALRLQTLPSAGRPGGGRRRPSRFTSAVPIVSIPRCSIESFGEVKWAMRDRIRNSPTVAGRPSSDALL